MKRLFAFFVSFTLLLGLTVCGSPAQPQAPSQPSGTTSSSSGSLSADNSSMETPSSMPEKNSQPEPPEEADGTLVVYFSASGNTRAVAENITGLLDANLYELVPEDPYTDADLNWNDPDSRVNAEHNNPNHRTAIAGELPGLSGYDTVFIGYPLWWRQGILWFFGC